MNEQQDQQRKIPEPDTMLNSLIATCGPPARFSDHKPGEQIMYRVSQHETRSGTILFVAAPSQVLSTHTPLTYICDSGNGFPDLVYTPDIVYET